MPLSRHDSYPAFVYLTALGNGCSPEDCRQAYEIAHDLNDDSFYEPPIPGDYEP